jgi:hypothetical protein
LRRLPGSIGGGHDSGRLFGESRRSGGNAVSGEDVGIALEVRAQFRDGQLVAVLHHLGAGQGRHWPLEKEQGFVTPRFDHHDIDVRAGLAVMVDRQPQLLARFNALALFPGKEQA